VKSCVEATQCNIRQIIMSEFKDKKIMTDISHRHGVGVIDKAQSLRSGGFNV